MSEIVTTDAVSQVSKLIMHPDLSEQQKIAKTISILERNTIPLAELRSILGSRKRRTPVVGLTGPSGVGKSTLLCRLLRISCENDLKVGVIAIDPASSDHGGAFLGDRIRLSSDINLDQVFFRSMASGENEGGLPQILSRVFELFDYFGFDLIFVETTGAGQLNTKIRSIASTLVNVVSPFVGDEIQMAKSGLMDIGDIFFINKSDLSDTGSLVNALSMKFAARRSKVLDNDPIILFGSASSNAGMEELFEQILSHQNLPGSESGDRV